MAARWQQDGSGLAAERPVLMFLARQSTRHRGLSGIGGEIIRCQKDGSKAALEESFRDSNGNQFATGAGIKPVLASRRCAWLARIRGLLARYQRRRYFRRCARPFRFCGMGLPFLGVELIGAWPKRRIALVEPHDRAEHRIKPLLLVIGQGFEVFNRGSAHGLRKG